MNEIVSEPAPKQKRKYVLSQRGLEAQQDRLRRLNADPDFKAKRAASSPLAALTPKQREDYDVMRKKGGYKREEALRMVLCASTTGNDHAAP